LLLNKYPIFVLVKNRIYAISLLLSFLVVLSHEMIAHHHHEAMPLNFSDSIVHDDDHELKHHQEEEHQHHDSEKEEKKKEHNHPFPFHQHFSSTNDGYIKRANILESNTQVRDVLFLVYTELFRTELSKPPNLEGKLYKEPPFLIPSLSYLEAFALRGPPAIV
jgi:hypothetical protein